MTTIFSISARKAVAASVRLSGSASASVTDVSAGRSTPASREERAIDELGRTIVSLFDGQGRVLQRTYPEGDQDRFRYDERDNVIELRKVAKPGAGLADLVVTASWDVTWNKPLWIKDARANQAGSNDRLDLTYWPSGSGGATGQIYQALQQPVTSGRPMWTFEYAATVGGLAKVGGIWTPDVTGQRGRTIDSQVAWVNSKLGEPNSSATQKAEVLGRAAFFGLGLLTGSAEAK